MPVQATHGFSLAPEYFRQLPLFCVWLALFALGGFSHQYIFMEWRDCSTSQFLGGIGLDLVVGRQFL